MVSLADVTRIIRNNVHKSTFNVDVNDSFEQKISIPQSIVKPETKPEATKNEIIEIPEYCEKFVDKDNYYMYSSENFLHALLFSIDESFRLGVSDQKKNQLDLVQLMLTQLGSLFLKNKQIYSKRGYKRSKLEQYLREINIHNLQEIEYSSDVVNLICDLKKINVIVLSVVNELYEKIESSESSDTNIIIVNENANYYPLMSIHGTVYNSTDINNILTYFKQKIKLNKIGSYTLADLQLLANNNSILVTLQNSSRKKTKQQLYDELTLLT